MKVENGVRGSPFNQQVSAREEKRSYLGICWFLDQGITQWCYVYLSNLKICAEAGENPRV